MNPDMAKCVRKQLFSSEHIVNSQYKHLLEELDIYVDVQSVPRVTFRWEWLVVIELIFRALEGLEYEISLIINLT